MDATMALPSSSPTFPTRSMTPSPSPSAPASASSDPPTLTPPSSSLRISASSPPPSLPSPSRSNPSSAISPSRSSPLRPPSPRFLLPFSPIPPSSTVTPTSLVSGNRPHPPPLLGELHAGRVGFFSSAAIYARAVLLVTRQAMVKFRWGVNFNKGKLSFWIKSGLNGWKKILRGLAAEEMIR